MTLPVKTLPIVEHWDCTGCGKCCRGNVVPLDDDDLKKLREQQWDRHADYRGVKTIVRRGVLSRQYQLAQRDDGNCVFLTDDGLCRIHKEFGFENKPLICRMYPLQLVPAGDTALLTLRRSCPTAAAEQGREMKSHLREARNFVRERPRLAERVTPPRVSRGRRLSWKETLLVTSGLEHLLRDHQVPLVRRLIHGLRFCHLIDEIRFHKVDSVNLSELVGIFRETAKEDVSELFRERPRPNRAATILFRQTLISYLRLHPLYIVRESWRERWRLAWAAFKFARGKEVPRFHPDFPHGDFESLEEPLGHFGEEVQRPMTAYFEANAVSKQYAIVSRPGWTIVERFRALALAYPVAMWMLRYFCQDKPPTVEDAIDMVTTIDRGQGHKATGGALHRRRISTLTRSDQLERLVVWYAR